jgi:hypothetical protein
LSAPAETAAPLFESEGELLMPSPAAAGPWDPGALHGGATAAILTRALEGVEPDPEMPFARLTFEFSRPVPRAPLAVTGRMVRPGRRIQLLEADVRFEGDIVARASGLRIRAGDVDVAPGAVPWPPPLPRPEEGHPPERIEEWGQGLITRMDMRMLRGDILETGPTTAWLRFRGPLIDEQAPTPLQRVVVAADFGNGLSSALDFRTHLYINPDLTVYLHRYPSDDWVGLDSATWVHDHGVGLAESMLWDLEGPIGRSLQSLLVAKRG